MAEVAAIHVAYVLFGQEGSADAPMTWEPSRAPPR
jgi:hypothetical protein